MLSTVSTFQRTVPGFLGRLAALFAIVGACHVSSGCRGETEHTVLATTDAPIHATLERRKDVEAGVVLASPHAPIALPYVKKTRSFSMRLADREVPIDAHDFPFKKSDELRIAVDRAAKRFAIAPVHGQWRMYYVPSLRNHFAVLDPDVRVTGDVDWESAPTLMSRLPVIYVRSDAYAAIHEARVQGGDHAVAELLRATAAQNMPDGAGTIWSNAFLDLSDENKAHVHAELHRLLLSQELPGIVRAVEHLPFADLAVAPEIARVIALRTDLPVAIRAAVLLASSTQHSQELFETACSLVSADNALSVAAALSVAEVRKPCPALSTKLLAAGCNVYPQCTGASCRCTASDAAREIARIRQTLDPLGASRQSWNPGTEGLYWAACRREDRLPASNALALARKTYDVELSPDALHEASNVLHAACNASADASEISVGDARYTIDDSHRRIVPQVSH